MSSFQCEHCGAICCDSERGYTTGCEHYPPDIGPQKGPASTARIEAQANAVRNELRALTMKQTDTDTLVQALRLLARDIESGDGVANDTIREAADRIETLSKLATDVIRASHRSDQVFIDCLRVDNDGAYKLGLALVRLGDQLREW